MSHRAQLVVYFAAVFAWTWGLAALLVLAPEWVEKNFGEMSATQPIFVLAVYGPTLVSVVLTAVFEGRAGLSRLVARLNPLRTRWWWLVAVPVGMLALSFVSGLLASWLGFGGMPKFQGLSALGFALTVMFLTEPGPLGEELGWRGFALPRMLAVCSPRWPGRTMTSGLVLGIIWAVWHLPAFFISGTPQQGFALPLFLVGALALSMIATWLFVRTSGSVLLSIVLHRMANGANDLTNVDFEVFALGMVVVALALVFFSKSMRGPAPTEAKIHGAG